MNAQTDVHLIAGPAGALEIALDRPAAGVSPIGLAVIAHPHPLFGGTRDNKVVQTIARALMSRGLICLRPNFRGSARAKALTAWALVNKTTSGPPGNGPKRPLAPMQGPAVGWQASRSVQ